jgi:hypothetical protein
MKNSDFSIRQNEPFDVELDTFLHPALAFEHPATVGWLSSRALLRRGVLTVESGVVPMTLISGRGTSASCANTEYIRPLRWKKGMGKQPTHGIPESAIAVAHAAASRPRFI